MHRLRFSKMGNGIWISHLDTMRMFQRAFRRANLLVKHTEGFNPHAFVSIAMPMSVGTESECELLDFTLLQEGCPIETVPEKLNAVLPQGVRVLEAYADPRKLSGLKAMEARLRLFYDQGVPEGCQDAIQGLLDGPELVVPKKSKRGVNDTDIRPLIRAAELRQPDKTTLELDLTVAVGEPSLNPDLIAKAVGWKLPDLAPDGYRTRRLRLLDGDGNPFR